MTTSELQRTKSLADYCLLGRSGLRVAPFCLGTMTFGTEWGWGSPIAAARQIWGRYLEEGGNFIDTADCYTEGKSEEMIGGFLKESGNRDRVVLATKYTFNGSTGDPNAGGNGRKNIYRALEGSLRRLQTDYVDLYWVHAWDTITPVEEVVSTLNDLVRVGKIRHIGLSNTPAWYLARAQTVAELRGLERIAAVQLEYSLVERNIEREHIPAALELGIGVCPWSPLAGGLLTGKYRQTAGGREEGEGRLIPKESDYPVIERFTEPNRRVVGTLLEVAQELGRAPAQVALNWVSRRPGVTSTIIGATKVSQLEDNLKALAFDIPEAQATRLAEVGRPESIYPYYAFEDDIQAMIKGGVAVRREPSGPRRG